MLKVESLKHSFDKERIILEDIKFSLPSGRILAIVGESGSGKTTLLNAIAGKLNFSGGTISFQDDQIKKPNEQLIAGHDEIKLVNQNYSGDLYFTVKENISNQLLHMTKEERQNKLVELIELLDLEKIQDYKSHLLSGGEKQRVSLACSLAQEPKLLLLDEPFSHLDVFLRKKVGKYIKKQVLENDLSLIIVTHEGEEALDWADEIRILNSGVLSDKLSPKNAYANIDNPVNARYFGEVNCVSLNGQQVNFRPWSFKAHLSNEASSNYYQIKVKFTYSSFRTGYYANYFNTFTGEEIVLYSFNELKEVQEVYVEK